MTSRLAFRWPSAGHALLQLLWVVVTALAVLPAQAASPVPSPTAATVPESHKSLGVGTCASSLCHGSIEPWKDSPVLQNEYITWSRQDKHARAYSVLLNARSREIMKKLGSKRPAQETKLCLDCHAHNPPAAERGENFQVSDGVSCEACHGASQGWIKTHVEPNATHARNVAHGLIATDQDLTRARLCLSCHLGTQQKFVTHKIMAAGHPRMSFELDTFTQIEPPHYRIDDDWQKRKGASNGVRSWAMGQAVAAQELLALLQSPTGRDGLFPELSLFDCHSCHHEMSDKRNTAARVGAGPGVVRLNDAGLLMLRQIVRRVEPQQAVEFSQQVSLLHEQVASGTNALAQAGQVESMIAAMVPKIAAHPFSNRDLQAILIGLIDDGLAGQYTDYQGAEQAVMAMQSVGDFMDRLQLLNAQSIRQPMQKLLAAVARDEQYDPTLFKKYLGQLRAKVLPEKKS